MEIERKDSEILGLNGKISDMNETIQDLREKIECLEGHVKELMDVNPEGQANCGDFGEIIKLQQKTNMDFKGMI